ncbi:hypothetical protein FF011L_45960 [Roseimaritima multifibrata]|uniref:Uncharacterized protein n=1 Tax=Roseimaritima multifibrata TaxID=1930274 RepID=A0A517MLL5_9BACT|nr:hypothetical protein [Roseimaritima multifibrata]QDS95795.1 hypothetical protein FF011L_45960 [Roseimaritima multifibrata]
MQSRFAVVLGAVALALVALRGGLRNEVPSDVLFEGLLAMLIFFVIGAVAGKIADYLVRQSVETQFRQRVAVFEEELQQTQQRDSKSDDS